MDFHAGLTGSVRSLFLFDIGESIDLSHIHSLLGSRPARREPAFRQPAPEYVRFERPPVTEQIGMRTLNETEEIEVRVRYFDYGVASVELLKRFRAGWDELTSLANRWMTSLDLEPWAKDELRNALRRTGLAVQNPNEHLAIGRLLHHPDRPNHSRGAGCDCRGVDKGTRGTISHRLCVEN